MARSIANLDQRIKQLEFELLEMEFEYKEQLYFETMPEYNPIYQYCYDTSNLKISPPNQHIDHWIRAVIKHMATRRASHGGARTASVLVTVPVGFSDKGIELWLAYTSEQLRKQAKKHGKRKVKS